MIKYRYLIYYRCAFTEKPGFVGCGNIITETSEKISTHEHINNLSKNIRNDNTEYKSVAIANIILLDTFETFEPQESMVTAIL
jgi:hypothetical protein